MTIALIFECIASIAFTLWLHKTKMGRFLKDDRTYVSVIMGVAGTLGIALLVLGPQVTFWPIVACFGATGAPIAAGELYLAAQASAHLWRDVKHESDEDAST